MPVPLSTLTPVATAPDIVALIAAGDILSIARGYRALGLSSFGVRTDGSKAACEKKWTDFCHRLPTDAELRAAFGRWTQRGIATACGTASGNLLVFDFEEWNAFARWGSMLSAEERDWLTRCPIVRTPRGGAHVYCRLTDSMKGTVYAKTSAGKVLIETRGIGHGVIAPGSPLSCHQTGQPYRLARVGWLDGGSFEQIPLDVFHSLTVYAAELNKYVKPTPREVVGDRKPPVGEAGDRPGDHFNGRVAWDDILTPHEWLPYRTCGDTTYWARPGKHPLGVSASTGHCRGDSGQDLFFCFSSSASPFEPGMNYSRFAAYAILNHCGSFAAATRALGYAGYGVPQRKAVRK